MRNSEKLRRDNELGETFYLKRGLGPVFSRAKEILVNNETATFNLLLCQDEQQIPFEIYNEKNKKLGLVVVFNKVGGQVFGTLQFKDGEVYQNNRNLDSIKLYGILTKLNVNLLEEVGETRQEPKPILTFVSENRVTGSQIDEMINELPEIQNFSFNMAGVVIKSNSALVEWYRKDPALRHVKIFCLERLDLLKKPFKDERERRARSNRYSASRFVRSMAEKYKTSIRDHSFLNTTFRSHISRIQFKKTEGATDEEKQEFVKNADWAILLLAFLRDVDLSKSLEE